MATQAPTPIQSSISADLEKELCEIQTSSHTGPPGDLDDNKKRWLVVGICLHSILSPTLRKYVDSVVTNLYSALVLSDQIDIQTQSKHLRVYGSANIYLNYEAINNNKATHGFRSVLYDYKVQNAVDLSKLFLQTHMTHYTAFDEACDSSALLGMINKIDKFPLIVQTAANDVRSTIRNEWAHCNFTVWDDVKYVHSLQLIEDLIYLLKLNAADEKQIIEKLNNWRKNGTSFLQGYTISFDIRQEIQVLAESAEVISKTADKEFGNVQGALIDIGETLRQYDKRISTLENTVATQGKSLKEYGSPYDDSVPTEIKLMADKRSVPLYLKLLESGSEKKRDIRLVVVGKKSAGKTSLIRRLFGEDIKDVNSTNGIEIHKIKCKAMSDDGIWNKLDGTNRETDIYTRLLKPFKGTIEASAGGAHKAVKENTPSTSFDESETVTQQPKKMLPSVTTESEVEPQVTTESQVEPPVILQQRNQALEQAQMDIEEMLKSNIDLHDKEEYATLLLWDFAGDEEFYHTHQTFLSQDAIYLVVTKLNEANDKKAKEMFQLWMNSIHCYCSTTEVLGTIEEKNKSLHPPVILVGSHKDKVEASEEVKIEDACRDCLDKYVEDVSADARRHISDQYEYFISNTEDNPSVFQLIRQNLLNLATTMKTWNQDYPIKFIQLEKCLQEKKELPIISLNEIKQISTETLNPLNHEELMLYLKFHHELRALVYFEDLPDYIILDTHWLSDAFKCIITAEKFQSGAKRHLFMDEWNDLNIRGILHSVVLDQILETNKKIFKFEEKQNLFQHKDHILNVMEKFDIIIRPTVSDRDAADTKTCYYIPCMVKQVLDCPINEQFNVTEKNCTKSAWLCFKFKFLPGHLMNHLIASLSRKYEIAEAPVRGQTKRPIALFRGTVVFKLQKTSKLLVMTYQNVIQIQVWDFGKHGNIERCFFKNINDFVTEEINTIISKRFKMTTVKFDKMLGCSLAEPDYVTGFYEQDADYFCEMCTETHINEWSDHAHIKLTEKSGKNQHVPGSYSCIENNSQIQTTSTKVRVHVKAGKRDHSNVSEEQSSECSLREFTKEEINFTKMGIIVLNILADVSYDLLKSEKPNLRPRRHYDISHLYKEHFKLKKHIPTNGWGGIWQTIKGTDIAIGDDIERIRLTRNELQHSTAAELGDTRFNELCNILSDLLKRFDHYNKPQKLYTDELKDILAKTITDEDVKSVKNELEMTVEVEIEQQFNVPMH